MRAGFHSRRAYDGKEARGDRPWVEVQHGQPPLPPPDFRFPPPWLVPRPPFGAPPPQMPAPDTRVPPHLLTWGNLVHWPPVGCPDPDALWHRDRDDRVPNEGEDERHEDDDVVFDDSGGYYQDTSWEEDETDDTSERFELNDLWLEKFAKTEIERKLRNRERRADARAEARIVTPAAAAAAAKVDALVAARRAAEALGSDGTGGATETGGGGSVDLQHGVDETTPNATQ